MCACASRKGVKDVPIFPQGLSAVFVAGLPAVFLEDLPAILLAGLILKSSVNSSGLPAVLFIRRLSGGPAGLPRLPNGMLFFRLFHRGEIYNCNSYIYPACLVEPGTLRVFNWG
jgi:hypothetical protein